MLRAQGAETAEAILASTLKNGPEIELDCFQGRWRLSRWRNVLGSYELPELPEPIFCVDLAKASRSRVWQEGAWSDASSYHGAVSIVPAEHTSRWRIDGELDVVILSMASEDLREASVIDEFRRMRWAYSDTLASTLVRQIVSALYTSESDRRTAYISALVEALKAHMLCGPVRPNSQEIPQCGSSSHRVHSVMSAIRANPAGQHRLEDMADACRLTASHFCRVFKKATGSSPHQFLLNTRIERARELLEHSDSSMATIATLAGFSSQSHFTRAFRSSAGEAPSDFRRRVAVTSG